MAYHKNSGSMLPAAELFLSKEAGILDTGKKFIERGARKSVDYMLKNVDESGSGLASAIKRSQNSGKNAEKLMSRANELKHGNFSSQPGLEDLVKHKQGFDKTVKELKTKKTGKDSTLEKLKERFVPSMSNKNKLTEAEWKANSAGESVTKTRDKIVDTLESNAKNRKERQLGELKDYGKRRLGQAREKIDSSIDSVKGSVGNIKKSIAGLKKQKAGKTSRKATARFATNSEGYSPVKQTSGISTPMKTPTRKASARFTTNKDGYSPVRQTSGISAPLTSKPKTTGTGKPNVTVSLGNKNTKAPLGAKNNPGYKPGKKEYAIAGGVTLGAGGLAAGIAANKRKAKKRA
jgi:NADH dehydrogenase/NADH:ubiquinone oxidoreductase subunit G